MEELMNILISFFCMALALASYEQAPPNFSYADGQAVFVDFQNALYELTYDLESKEALVETTITFKTSKEGYPIFDLIPDPSEVVLDGQSSTSETIKDPDQQTTLRVLRQHIGPGQHELKLKHVLSKNVVFGTTGVASGFWTSDLTDRQYLEQYLPTSFEYDQYKMKIIVNIKGTHAEEHVIKANGKVSKTKSNQFEIVYPDFYTASSAFFHLLPESNPTKTIQFYYSSIDGRLIPVEIYTSFNVEDFATYAKAILKELEGDYGPFPHNQVVIYGNAPSGGMEYSGAAATSYSALAHELFHSYHARAVMPANGNAGWMDEAIARFRDNKYPLVEKLSFDSTHLAGHSLWARLTDRMAYKEGSAFLSWIAYRMSEKGLSFKGFLKNYFEKYKYTTVTTELFQREVSKASGLDLEGDFNRYVYGKSTSTFIPEAPRVDAFHPKLSKEELRKLTWP